MPPTRRDVDCGNTRAEGAHRLRRGSVVLILAVSELASIALPPTQWSSIGDGACMTITRINRGCGPA